MASTPSPLGVPFPLTVTHNENAVDPRFVFGYRLGTGVPVGPTPRTPAPPCTALAGPRCTMRDDWPIRRRRRPAAARRRRGRPDQIRVTLRCAAQSTETATAALVQGHAEASRGILWEARAVRGGGEPGALRPPPHRPRPLRAPSLPTLLVPMDVPSVLAVGARRSSGHGGDAALVTDALAARLVVHYCTGGSNCSARRARAAASIGSAKCARARSAVPRTARGKGTKHTQTHVPRDAVRACRSAHSADGFEFGIAGRAAPFGV